MAQAQTSPQVDTLETIKAFDVNQPTDEELRIAEEVAQLQERHQELVGGLNAFRNRKHAVQRERTETEALIKIGRAKVEDTKAARGKEEVFLAEMQEVDAEIQAVADQIDEANERLAYLEKERHSQFLRRLDEARQAAVQSAIDAVWIAFDKMWDVREFNQIWKAHGETTNVDAYLLHLFFQSLYDVPHYFNKMRDLGFEAPKFSDMDLYIKERGGVHLPAHLVKKN